MSEIDIDNKSYYEYKGDDKKTRQRLIQIKELGLTECGIAQFGLTGRVSGLYIERVWSHSDEKWDDCIEWIKTFRTDQEIKLDNRKTVIKQILK